jgi:RNA polymerase sigma-70 factor (ECF subfamily)
MRLVTVPPDEADAAYERSEARLLNDERERLLRCIRSLPAQERLALSMRYFDGLGVREIATLTGLAVGTITKQLSRALQRMRDQLNEERNHEH